MIRNLFYSIPYVIEQMERTRFDMEASVARNVDLDDYNDTHAYANKRGWCREMCRAKWRCIPLRLQRIVIFEFESSEDAENFARRFPH